MGNHNQNSEAKIRCWEVQNHNQNSASKVRLWCSKIKIQQPWSGKCFDNELTSSTRHSISLYIAIYAISKGHQTPCTAIRREQRYHLNSAFRLSAFKGKDVIILLHVISFCIYFYLPSLDRFVFLSENLGNRNVPIFRHFSTQKLELFRLNRNTWQVCQGQRKTATRTLSSPEQ